MPRPVFVFELAVGPAPAIAGRLLADAGFTVVKIVHAEPIGSAGAVGPRPLQGDSRRSAFSRHFDAGKLSLDAGAGGTLERLLEVVQEADIVIEDSDRPSRTVARKVVIDVEHGLQHPERVESMSGLLATTGTRGGDPVALGGDLPAYHQGALLAATVLALQASGCRSVWFDPLAAAAGRLAAGVARRRADGWRFERGGDVQEGDLPTMVVAAADGEVLLQAGADWPGLANLLGLDPTIRPDAAFPKGWERVVEAIRWAVAGRRRDEIEAAAQELRLPVLAVRSVAEVARDRHWLERGDIQDGVPTSPVSGRAATAMVTVELPALLKRRKSRTPESSSPARRAPLAGVRVVDLTGVYAGPYLTWLLAELGADVIRVESISRPTRRGRTVDGVATFDADPFYAEFNRGKRAIELDLSRPKGLKSLLTVLASADVLVENYSPRVLDNWGIPPDVLLERFPTLVGVSMSAFGRTGPRRNWIAYGAGVAAASGLQHLTRDESGVCAIPGLSPTDPTAGAIALVALLAALRRKAATGRGEWLDLAQVHAVAFGLGPEFLMSSPAEREPAETASGVDAPAPWEAVDRPWGNRMFEEIEHPLLGPLCHARAPWRFEGLDLSAGRAPFFGEHDNEILGADPSAERDYRRLPVNAPAGLRRPGVATPH